MKNIAVIIPTYNSHKTIKKTLHSLACQLNKSFRVYLAVDGEPEGTYDYLLNQFDTLDMEILYCPTNGGPGNARQYAINNTYEPFITFIDSDDILNSVSALDILYTAFEDKDVLVITPHWREEEDGSFKMKAISMVTWMHGKMYRRSFLEKYNIHFNPEFASSNEDVGFNTQIFLLADEENERIKSLTGVTTYIQLNNGDSITQRNDREFSKSLSGPGFVKNKLYAIEHVLNQTGNNEYIQEAIILSMAHFYLNFAHLHFAYDDYEDNVTVYIKEFYNKLYPYVEGYTKDIKKYELEIIPEDEYEDYEIWKETITKEAI